MRRCFTLLSPLLVLFCCINLGSCQFTPRNSRITSVLDQLGSLNEHETTSYMASLERTDPIGPYYKDPLTKEKTLQFFASLTQSEDVARYILESAGKFSVRPSLAFALALEESEFKVAALNMNGDSVDRGLFQLNSKSYPNLSVQDFYNPETNARYGVAHLKSCLVQAGNEVAALAMYNAGNGRVERGATPQKTLNYVSRILAYEDNISSLFAAKVIAGAKPASPGVARLIAESVSMGLVSEVAR
jgi:soluble lytic murein transglycosylase-like protein